MKFQNDLGLLGHEARVNITWNGQNGDLLEPVPFTASDHQLKEWAREALVGGSIPGETKVASVAIYEFVEIMDYSTAHIYSAIMLVLSFTVLLGVYLFNQRHNKRIGIGR